MPEISDFIRSFATGKEGGREAGNWCQFKLRNDLAIFTKKGQK